MANIFAVAEYQQRVFSNILAENDKQTKTTFYKDLTLAELVGGAKGVRDTVKRVVASWQNDVEYMSEFVVALNHKIWQHYKNNESLARVYDELWCKVDEDCREYFKGDDLNYYYKYID